jgi:hypothetical protein
MWCRPQLLGSAVLTTGVTQSNCMLGILTPWLADMKQLLLLSPPAITDAADTMVPGCCCCCCCPTHH